MNFKSLAHLLDHFKDEKTCVEHYEQVRWFGNPVCPHCKAEKPYRTNRGWKCSNRECLKKFTVKVGTIFENSKIPFRLWFAAIYLATSHKKGISSLQLAIDLGITQKTAWFILHRIREMLANQSPKLLGKTDAVEVDESFVGGKEKNRHKSKKRSDENPDLSNDGKPYNKKKVVLGLIDRNGKVLLKYIPGATSENMVPIIHKYVPVGTKVYTDESKVYKRVGRKYPHATVNHKVGVYVTGDAHTNTIENFWSVLKRCLNGTYHQVSNKHFERYLNEIAARFNERGLPEPAKFHKFLQDSEGRLTYRRLIGKA